MVRMQGGILNQENGLLPIGRSVLVAYHLHKKCLSIRDRKSRRVITYRNHIALQNVTFIVHQRGRERVLMEQRKNVHAFIAGKIVQSEDLPSLLEWRVAYYNPYLTREFIDKETLIPLLSADWVICSDKMIYYSSKE